MEIFELVLESVEAIGIVAAFIISIVTLRQNNKIIIKKNKSEILTKKRSERIDQLRSWSSAILSEGELRLLDEKVNVSNLVLAVNNYASLLQYNLDYKDDVKLIKMVHHLKEIILGKSLDKEALKNALNDFYFYNDLYVSIEYSRVASEINKNNTDEYQSVEAQKEEALQRKEEFVSNYNELKNRNETIY